MTQVRLQKYLSSGGVAARRKAEELITAGRVRVNGKVTSVLGTKIDPDRDAVTVDGEAVVAHDYFYVLLNKPKGCITAVSDDRGRPTVMDYLPNLPVPVRPVGRLDFYSEGVLLLTNDGELAAKLLAPTSHVPKTYHVKVHGQLRPDHFKALRAGVRLDDGSTTLPAEVVPLPGESKHTWLAITLHEGKQRQIHRMLEALNYRVDKLQRVAFANLSFHELRVGDARELTQNELNDLRDAAGLPRGPVARGRWRALREKTDMPRRARAKGRAEAEAEAEGGQEGPRASGLGPPQSRSSSSPQNRGASSPQSRGSSFGRRGDGPRSEGPRGQGPRGRGQGPRASGYGPPQNRSSSAPENRSSSRVSRSEDARPARPRSGGPRPEARGPSAAPRGGQGRTFGKRARPR